MKVAKSVILFGAASFTLGCGLLIKDFLSIYDLAGRSSGFCKSNCLSSEMATTQLNKTGMLRTVDIVIIVASIAITTLGLVLLARAQKQPKV